MKRWLISKIPTWVLRYLVKKDWRLRQTGRKSDKWCWANLALFLRDVYLCPDCYNDIDFAEDCPYCTSLGPEKPVGVPEWLATKPESYGYEDEPDDHVMYKGIPFFYDPCFCDRSIGESCEACHPDRRKR